MKLSPLGIVSLVLLLPLSHAAIAAEEPTAEPNPYLAKANLPRAELDEFIERMLSKPETIRKRPGFHEAVVDAADRVLAGGMEDEPATRALQAKFAALHAMSLAESKTADESLATLADAHLQDKRRPIAAAAKFYHLEAQVRAADDLEEKEIEAILTELKQFFATETLYARHLRIASGTVRIINRLKDDAAAVEAYRQFGSWFAKSKDPELARYGRKVEKAATKADAP